jgi:hypothetical protein
VKVQGLAAIDRRTSAARALLDWRRELLSDLGGEAAVSAQQRALVELACRARLYVDHLDAVLMARASLVTRKGRAIPLVEQRQRLADGLVNTLVKLGLERRAGRVPTLADYVRDKYSASGPETVGGADPVPTPAPSADHTPAAAGGPQGVGAEPPAEPGTATGEAEGT